MLQTSINNKFRSILLYATIDTNDNCDVLTQHTIRATVKGNVINIQFAAPETDRAQFQYLVENIRTIEIRELDSNGNNIYSTTYNVNVGSETYEYEYDPQEDPPVEIYYTASVVKA